MSSADYLDEREELKSNYKQAKGWGILLALVGSIVLMVLSTDRSMLPSSGRQDLGDYLLTIAVILIGIFCLIAFSLAVVLKVLLITSEKKRKEARRRTR